MSVKDDFQIDELKEIGRQTEEKMNLEHRIDNLYMLTYTILLAMSVLTIWLFKHRRFRYVHETGLSVLYGLIVGAIFRYGVPEHIITTQVYSIPPENSSTIWLPPEKAILHLRVTGQVNTSRFYHYSFTSESKEKESAHYRMIFNPEIFFNVLLPPIIFTAGYSMKRKHFFKNFGCISVFAFLGTLVSAVLIAFLCYGFSRLIPSLIESLNFSDCVYFGSIISATDPVTVLAIFNDLNVDVDLYALVFGESILNDAVAIALAQAVEGYDSVAAGSFKAKALFSSVGSFLTNLCSSFLLGTAIAFFTALLTKYTHIRDYPLLETVLFVLLSYSTFFLSESVGFTGIVALLFCGVSQAHYTFNNLSPESRLWTKQAFELLNFLAENFVFAYIGVSTFSFRSHNWNAGFILITLFACCVSRALSIYPLAAIINCVQKRKCGAFVCCRNERPSISSVSEVYQNRHRPNTPFSWKRLSSEDLQRTASSSSGIGGDFGEAQKSTAGDDSFGPGLQSSCAAGCKSPSLGCNKQHMLVFCGLRGAMAFSLAIRNTSTTVRQMFFSTTIIVVMITVFLGGCLATPMLQWLKIPVGSQSSEDSQDGHSSDHSSRSVNENVQHGRKQVSAISVQSYRQRNWWHRFDARFMKPLLTHSGPLLSDSLPRCCLPVADWLTTSDQRQNVISSYSGFPNYANMVATPNAQPRSSPVKANAASLVPVPLVNKWRASDKPRSPLPRLKRRSSRGPLLLLSSSALGRPQLQVNIPFDLLTDSLSNPHLATVNMAPVQPTSVQPEKSEGFNDIFTL